MPFLDQRLPTKVEIGAARFDYEDIEIVTTDGLWEVRNARHSQSLLGFEISFPIGEFDDSTIAAVKAMYKVARGSLYAFRFRDVSNYELAAEAIGTGDNANKIFQIKQSWTVDGNTHSRNITRPVTPMSVYLNGSLQGSGYSIDYATGILTFTAAPGVGVIVSVTGEFDIPVRFDTPMSSVLKTGWLEHIETMTLKEVRE